MARTGFRHVSLNADTRAVRFTRPAGMVPTVASGAADTTAADSDPLFVTMSSPTGDTLAFDLTSGDDEPDVDAGFYRPASIGDVVWEDIDADGVQDGSATEPGVAAATVSLWRTADGGATWTQVTQNVYGDVLGDAGTITTPADGAYVFADLAPGTYEVRFTPPAGMVFTAAGSTVSETDSNPDPATGHAPLVTVASGDVVTEVDAGVFAPVSIGDYVWFDDDADGVQDVDEDPVPNASVTLWIDTDGDPSTVGWIQVTTDIAGNPLPVATTADGSFVFHNLEPGIYQVRVSAVPDTVLTDPAAATGTPATDSDPVPSDASRITGATPAIVLMSGATNTEVDAGMVKLGAIGDLIWHDVNGNGQQDAGEPPVAGAQVTLWVDADGDPTTDDWTQVSLDANGVAYGIVTTGGDGLYLFDNLEPGVYQVRFTPPAGGYEFTDMAIGPADTDSNPNPVDGSTGSITLAAGEDVVNVDAGVWLPVAVGDLVWLDVNGNGIQDTGEAGISGVLVELLDADGNVIAADTTDAAGRWWIDRVGNDQSALEADVLAPGIYVVRFTRPAGLFPSASTGAPDEAGDDSDAVFAPSALTGATEPFALTSGVHETAIDAGFWPPATVSGTVWIDSTDNGINDSGDTALAGVKISLTGTDNAGNQITITVVTGTDGSYTFTNVPPGIYTVTETQPDGVFDAHTLPPTGPNGGTVTPNAHTGLVMTGGNTATHYDFIEVRPGSISGMVHQDIANDGAYTPGIDWPLANVTLALTGQDRFGNPVNRTTVTGVDGTYTFSGLPPGSRTSKSSRRKSTGRPPSMLP